MRRPSLFLAVLAALVVVLGARAARADDTRQASKHFQRGVSLYGEADYRAALVEFRRAYALAPNAAVLYNVGETQYQLQDYAAALTTFEHFLAEASPADPHRGEVEGDLDVLRARVGHVSVTTIPPGADVVVDDQPVGKTPFERPLLVSIGHRKIVATLAGRPPVTRTVDVATDDSVSVTMQLPDPPEAAPAATHADLPARPPDSPPPSHGGATLRVLGWTATAMLAAGAITTGVLAFQESRSLETARATYPASAQILNHDASMTTTYSTVADVLTAGAVVVGGATLLSTLLSHSPSTPARGSNPPPQIVLGPTSARLFVTF
jgi:PEGA domain